MTRPMAAVLTATLAFSACDLPTNADEARAHLARNQQERIIPMQLPLPEISVTLADQLGELSSIVDTTDLSFGLDPDTFAFALDSLLVIDPVDPDPITQGLPEEDFQIGDFDQQITETLPAIPINLPGTDPIQVPLFPGASDTQTIEVSLDAFTTATFAAGSSFLVILATDGTTTVEVDAEIQDGSGGTVAGSDNGPIELGPNTTDTLVISLGGRELPSTFDLLVSFDASAGDFSGDELSISTEFADASVTAATGVDASLISDVTFDQAVTLEAEAGSEFSQATMAAGMVSVDFQSGDLIFEPAFDGDLTGLQIGGSNPDQIQVTGQVKAPDGATRVDITNTAELTISFTGLEVASVTLNSVSLSVDQAVTVQTDGALDDLESIVIDSGTLQVDLVNRLGVSGTVTLTLTGITDPNGDVLTESFSVAPSPDGSPVTSPVTVDLADATLDPSALAPTVTGTIGGTNVTVTPEAAAEAVVVDPYLEINARQVVLAGVPDMSIELDERVPLATEDVDLGQLADILDRISFNDVAFTVAINNGTGLDVEVEGFQMALLDAAGAPILDAAGDPISVSLGDETTGVATAPAETETVLTADAADLVNALLDRVAAGEDVQLAAGGTMGPAGETGTITLGDSISVVFDIRLAPDITIDPQGITLDRVVHQAVELDTIVSNFLVDLSEDLVSAGIEFEAVNGMPLGLALAMTLAPTPADTTDFDPWASPNRLDLPRFSIDAGQVDDEGRVTAPTISTPETQVDPAEFGVLAERALSMGMRAELLAPEGGRAQLQPSDSLVLRPLLKIEIRVGGNGGTQ